MNIPNLFQMAMMSGGAQTAPYRPNVLNPMTPVSPPKANQTAPYAVPPSVGGGSPSPSFSAPVAPPAAPAAPVLRLPSQDPEKYGMMTPKQAYWSALASNIGNIISTGNRAQLVNPGEAQQQAALNLFNADRAVQTQQLQQAQETRLRQQMERDFQDKDKRDIALEALRTSNPRLAPYIGTGLEGPALQSMNSMELAKYQHALKIEEQRQEFAQRADLERLKAELGGGEKENWSSVYVIDPATNQMVQGWQRKDSTEVVVADEQGNMRPIPPQNNYLIAPTSSQGGANLLAKLPTAVEGDMTRKRIDLQSMSTTIQTAKMHIAEGGMSPGGVGAVASFVEDIRGLGQDVGTYLRGEGLSQEMQDIIEGKKTPASENGRLKYTLVGLEYDLAKLRAGGGGQALSDKDLMRNINSLETMSTSQLWTRLDEMKKEVDRTLRTQQAEIDRVNRQRAEQTNRPRSEWLSPGNVLNPTPEGPPPPVPYPPPTDVDAILRASGARQ